jgi:hypothetical protein
VDVESSSVTSSRNARILFSELRKLHVLAGEPGSREVATSIGGVSHTTVNNAIRGKTMPSWPVLSKIVKELGGDEALFRGLWAAVREEGVAVESLPSPVGSRPDVSIFVSYAPIDERATHGRIEEIVLSIKDMYASMTGEDVRVFFDKSSLSAGETWQDAVRFGLSSSSIFLVFLSPSYIRSAACNNEFWELYHFLESNSSERLMIPLLFGDKERIARADPQTGLWSTASQLLVIDVSSLRIIEPSQTVWLQKAQEIAEVIDRALSSVKRRSVHQADAIGADRSGDDDVAPILLEQMLQFEAAAPELMATMEDLTDLLYKVGSQVNASGPLMKRATTTKRKLSVACQLARSIDPIADQVDEEVTTFLRSLKVWDVTVQTVFDFMRRSSTVLSGESVLPRLRSVYEMATAGIRAFDEAEVMHRAIGQGRGLSYELDAALKKLQSAALRLVDSRAMFTSWRAGASEFIQATSVP